MLCWHKWSVWKDVEFSNTRWLWQERTCLKCGKRQLHKVEVV